MVVNPDIHYQKAEKEYLGANTTSEKMSALKNMLSLAPKHKGAENLVRQIKERIAKLKAKQQKEIKQRKSSKSIAIKKEGAATVCLVGTTNSGKSTLLSKLTNAKPEIAEYEFTTKKPEIGTMDYYGIKIQIIEIPAVVKNFIDSQNGPAYLAIIRNSDLIVLMYKTNEERRMLEEELEDVNVDRIYYDHSEDFHNKLWKKLDLLKVYTKTPSKPKEYPPIAFKKGVCVKDVAEKIHKDFIKKFKFARVWGKSVKHEGARVSLNHILEDNDVVELHVK